VSPYYSDNFTDKPREIDIIAERLYDANEHGTVFGGINARLFIECKYVNVDTVFWFDDKDKNRAVERIINDTGLEHPSHNTNIRQHHYFDDAPVAKLFSSRKTSGEDGDLINKAINQNLNALIYYRDRYNRISEPNSRYKILQQIPYPLIVVNSFEKFFRTNMADDTGSTVPITEPFQLEVNYAYIDKNKSGRNEYFLIDVVSIDKLPSFFSMLETRDIKTICNKAAYDESQRIWAINQGRRDGGVRSNPGI
jgi:hypothetical protein